jgi:hypothetical protein
VLTLVEQMAQANHQLAGRLQAALRLLYRKKSERVSPAQLALCLAQLPRAEAAQAAVAAAPPDDPAAAAPPDDPAAAAPRRPRGKQLRNPTHVDRRFRRMSIGDSDPCRSSIPMMSIGREGRR